MGKQQKVLSRGAALWGLFCSDLICALKRPRGFSLEKGLAIESRSRRSFCEMSGNGAALCRVGGRGERNG